MTTARFVYACLSTCMLLPSALAEDFRSNELGACPDATPDEASIFTLIEYPPPTFAELPEITFVGARAFVDAHKTSSFEEIPKAYGRLAELMPSIQNAVNPFTVDGKPAPGGPPLYEVCFSLLGETGFSFMPAVEVSEIDVLSEDADAVALPPQTYAIFRFQGPRADDGNFRYSLTSHFWPNSSIQRLDMPNFAVYRPGDDGTSETTTFDLYVAVDPATVD